MLISIIIPVYNEEKFILKLLVKIKSVKNIKKEVIIVNDGSTDKTFEILKKNKLKKLYTKLITYKKNRGKGFACRKGIQNANGKIIIIQDGDLEYNPKNYSKLLKPILLKKTNIVYGSRVLHGGKRVRPNTFGFKIRIFANHFLTYLSNLINDQKLTDAHTCYKVFKKDTVKRIKLQENGFNFCPEITTKFSKLNEKIIEVPIDYFGRTIEEGKKIQFLDGFRAIYCLIKYKFIFK